MPSDENTLSTFFFFVAGGYRYNVPLRDPHSEMVFPAKAPITVKIFLLYYFKYYNDRKMPSNIELILATPSSTI